MKAAIILTICVFIASCSVKNQSTDSQVITSNIINGKAASTVNVLSHSVVAILKLENKKIWYTNCTGIVLSENKILTAAHCLDGQRPQEMLVNFSINSPTYASQHASNTFIGVKDIPKKFEVRKVQTYKIHPNYGLYNNDLGIIILKDKIPSHAIPVKLLPDEYIDQVGEHKTTLEGQNIDLTLLGFGITDEYTRKEKKTLQITTVPGRFEDQFVISDQTKGSGACNGDSGGPAFITLEQVTYLVGVTHGPNVGSTTCHEEGQWTNPVFYKDFLK